jgi:N utilization substance protein B
MLNRRILRAKVMQAVFSYKQAEKSDYLLALDQIEGYLQKRNDLDSDKAEGYRQLAILYFEEHYQQEQILQEELPDVAFAAVKEAIVHYRNLLRKDQELYRKQMTAAISQVYQHYLSILALIVETGKVARFNEESRSIKPEIRIGCSEGVLEENRYLKALRENDALALKLTHNGINWEKDAQMVRKFYRDDIRKDSLFEQYLQTGKPGEELEKEIIDLIVRKIFKNQVLEAYFEEKDLYWQENQAVVKSMVKKTLKGIQTHGIPELQELSRSWEEDQAFYLRLYDHTLEEDLKREAYIAQKIKNWDIERVALTDKVILAMALAEMIHFPAIPVKVTLNECIELSKTYSTPKSRQFVNGMLDIMIQELVADKTIRKSGLGLLDNK